MFVVKLLRAIHESFNKCNKNAQKTKLSPSEKLQPNKTWLLISDWIYQPTAPTKKGEEPRSATHKQLWSRYNDNRPRNPSAPIRIAPSQHGPFIHYIGPQGPNRPILPRNAIPLQPLSMVPFGNQAAYPNQPLGLRVVRPQHSIFGETLQASNLFNGKFCLIFHHTTALFFHTPSFSAQFWKIFMPPN